MRRQRRAWTFDRLLMAARRATDRAWRRSERNDTVQDVRLQRQARGMALVLTDLAEAAYRGLEP